MRGHQPDEVAGNHHGVSQCLESHGHAPERVVRTRGFPQDWEPESLQRWLVAHQHHGSAAGRGKDSRRSLGQGAPIDLQQCLVLLHAARGTTGKDRPSHRPQRRTLSFWPGWMVLLLSPFQLLRSDTEQPWRCAMRPRESPLRTV